MFEPWADVAYVGEDADVDTVDFDAEAARLLDIVRLVEAVCGERADGYGVSDVEETDAFLRGSVFDSHAVESATGHVGHGASVSAQSWEAVDVVGVLVRDEHGTNFLEVNVSSLRSVLQPAETDAHVDD